MKRDSRTHQTQKPWSALHVAVLVIITVAVYANSLRGEFVFDDQHVVFQNTALMNVQTFKDVLSIGASARQLLHFTYALNYYLGATDTLGYHLFNVLLHGINTILVYFIILTATAVENIPQRGYAAVAGAAIFGVHTVFTGAVSYIAGRSSVLCATFYFLAILLFLKAIGARLPGARAAYLFFVCVAGLLAWYAKQEAIALPIFLAALLLFKYQERPWRWIGAIAVILAVALVWIRQDIAIIYSALTDNREQVAAGFEPVLSPFPFFQTYVTSIVAYCIPRFVAPTGLSADPDIPTVQHWYSLEFLFAVTGIALLFCAMFRFRKSHPMMVLGLAALMISPMSAYALMPMSDVVQEHRLYIPGLGIAFLAGALLSWISRKNARLRWPALIAAVLVLSVMTIQRNAVWASNVSLWSDAEAKAGQKPRPHFNLGQTYQLLGRFDEAIKEYEHAIRLKPDLHAAYANLGSMYLDRNDLGRAEQTLLRVVELAPALDEAFVNLGAVYIRMQQTDKAIQALDRALAIRPGSYTALLNKGDALMQKADFRGALNSYESALSLRPDVPLIHLSVAKARTKVGDSRTAEAEFRTLLDGPLAADAYRGLGVLQYEAGRQEKAIEYLKQAVSIRPAFAEAHNDLAILYLQQRKPDDAIRHLKSTLLEQPTYAPAVLNLALAYQFKGDVESARQVLQDYLQRYSGVKTQDVAQIEQRLLSLR